MNEIIQKFTSRDEKEKTLKELRENNNKKQANLEKDKQVLQEEIKNLRMQLVSAEPVIVSTQEKEEGRLRIQLQRAMAKNDLLTGLLISAQNAVAHFNERMEIMQIEGEDTPIEDQNMVESLKRFTQRAKAHYQVVERNRHFNELCKSKSPLVCEHDLIEGFAQNIKN